jgi:hypothetical protein
LFTDEPPVEPAIIGAKPKDNPPGLCGKGRVETIIIGGKNG